MLAKYAIAAGLMLAPGLALAQNQVVSSNPVVNEALSTFFALENACRGGSPSEETWKICGARDHALWVIRQGDICLRDKPTRWERCSQDDDESKINPVVVYGVQVSP